MNLNLPSSEDLRKNISRKSHLKFMEYCWMKDRQQSPFTPGFHTIKICEAIDQAMIDFRNGKSSYLVIKVPFRHGKSDILSRYLPPHFLGEFPESEIITTAYNASLAKKFSKDAKNIITNKYFSELYPDCRLHPDIQNVEEWALDNGVGKTLWVGLGGGLTGAGATLALVDDPFKNREEAESITTRDKRWEEFTNALFTRLAPVHIIILLATPWHEDDLFGRISREMSLNKHFPRFKELSFPAKADHYCGEGRYDGQFLFMNRYPKSWYESQYAILGKYASSGLLDCSPKPRDGSLLSTVEGRNWHFVDEKPEGFGRMARAWDLASSSPKTSSDPDYTVGVKGAVKINTMDVYDPSSTKSDKMRTISIYIEDIVRLREEATKRNQKMLWTAHNDGAGVFHLIESFGAQKDTVSILKGIIGGSRIIKGVRLKGDKMAKASEALEVPFAMGNVYINSKIAKPILDEFLSCLEGFPSASHDDDVDALTILVTELANNYGAWWM